MLAGAGSQVGLQRGKDGRDAGLSGRLCDTLSEIFSWEGGNKLSRQFLGQSGSELAHTQGRPALQVYLVQRSDPLATSNKVV